MAATLDAWEDWRDGVALVSFVAGLTDQLQDALVKVAAYKAAVLDVATRKNRMNPIQHPVTDVAFIVAGVDKFSALAAHLTANGY